MGLRKDQPSPRSSYILKHGTGIQMLLQNTHDYFSSCNSEFSVYRDMGTGAQGPTRPVFSQSNHIMKGCSETSLSEAFAKTAKSNAEDPRLHDILSCWKDQRAGAGTEGIRLSWPLSYLLKTLDSLFRYSVYPAAGRKNNQFYPSPKFLSSLTSSQNVNDTGISI